MTEIKKALKDVARSLHLAYEAKKIGSLMELTDDPILIRELDKRFDRIKLELEDICQRHPKH